MADKKEEQKEKQLKSETALREEKILEFWNKEKIFEKTLEKESPKGEFVFYEGPPTANAKPALHHLEARAFKDIIPRFKTMQGFHVARKGGWDTHGLPVELQIEKKLGLQSKKDIESFGIEAFNKECKDSVFQYIGDWEKFTDRIGYWVDKKNAYFTFNPSYMESVWNIIKTVDEKKLLYKDYKVLPWCPRCGTALSSHELAQGYEDDKDLSVTTKFKVVGEENTYLNTYLLAWTTTPWTLPGNVALAVGKDIEYVKIKVGEEYLILAKARLSVVSEEYELVSEMKGSDLAGLSYEPLYSFLSEKFTDKNPESFEKAYKVYEASFVNTTDGTGIVHTAVMYGQDDFELGTTIGLPKFHLVKEDGHFLDGMPLLLEDSKRDLSNRYVKEVDLKGKPTLAVDIVDDLKKRNLFFSQENIKHSYPHCWRCKTALIYYARDSWYIRMSSLRKELVSENEDIHWEPKHIKEGRFGEWLREIKDWAISRERYWGTPLPIWTDSEGNYRVVGSVDELRTLIEKSGNRYFVMRHGQTEGNVKQIWSTDSEFLDPLTETGREQVHNSAKKITEKIDFIIASPFPRTQETARLTAEILGIAPEHIITDPHIGEWNAGRDFNGKNTEDFFAIRNNSADRFTFKTEDGESYADVCTRAGKFLYSLEEKYKGKNILIITHGAPARAMSFIADGFSHDKAPLHMKTFNNFDNADVREINFVPLPHNENYELDLHRPHIDTVKLVDLKGEPLTRVKEVMDVWFDSGSMPFAQVNYPFSEEKLLYPADFISEAIDQTRGWFYTLHSIGVLMGKGNAYKNVICLGHILDSEGKKMSKSVGNIVNPQEMIDLYGVDALRLWMYSVNQPGDSKNFDSGTVDEIVKKVFNPMRNIVSFYELYLDESTKMFAGESKHVLDRWIVARLNEVIEEGTQALESYQVFESARLIRDFVNDFSTWYVRRSRDRFKSENRDEKNEALRTTRFVLLELVKYMAPFTPFFAEDVYRSLRLDTDRESIHLADWPEAGDVDENLLRDMQKVRETVTRVLELRAKANIKVRQPLASLVVREDFSPELRTIIAEEVNIKEVASDPSMASELELDIALTPDLIEEGIARDLIRAIQDARKKENLLATQTIDLSLQGIGVEFLSHWGAMIQKPTGVKTVTLVPTTGTHTLTLDNLSISFSLVY